MRKLSAALVIMFLANPAPAFCKHKEKDSSNKSEDKKHALVDQIIDAVQAEKLTDDERAELEKKQDARVDKFVDAVADKMKMSDEEKTKIKARLNAKKDAHKQLPPEVKAALEKRFDFKNFSKDMTYQVLTDHFDDKDLKSLLKFLKSPIGKKLMKQTPDMLGEATEMTLEKYVPIVIDMIKEIKIPKGLSPKDGPSPEKKREMMEKLRQLFEQNQKAPIQGPGKDET
ncbi:MAG: DUF2059 domain-containing protein [Candidatus Obscuribacterales bacterium]|nr:DUF2059 domain-containing protein [Candidatus Obscuribacterales bacterium]